MLLWNPIFCGFSEGVQPPPRSSGSAHGPIHSPFDFEELFLRM